MRITYRDKRYSIDRVAYTAFLKEQGFTDVAIGWLNVYVQPRNSGKTARPLWGEFRAPSTIFLYTQTQTDVSDLNETLLHETRHYWQEMEWQQRRDEAGQRLKGRAYQKFLMNWLSEKSRELEWAYEDRPCEQDANAYASRFAKDWLFIVHVE